MGGQEIRRRFGTQPWMPREFGMSSFKNRFSAQQDAIKEQQRQIKEQQRLIEELQSEQRQQVYRQCLKTGADSRDVIPDKKKPDAPPRGREIPRGNEAGGTGRQPATEKPCRSKSDVVTHREENLTDRSNISTERSDHSESTHTTNNNSAAPRK